MIEKIRTRERIEAGKKTARSGYIPSVRERRKMLRRMLVLLVSHREAAYAVLEGDLGRSRQGAIVSEILPLIKTIKYLMRHLPSLTSARRCSIPWINFRGVLMKFLSLTEQFLLPVPGTFLFFRHLKLWQEPMPPATVSW